MIECQKQKGDMGIEPVNEDQFFSGTRIFKYIFCTLKKNYNNNNNNNNA